MTDKTYWGHYEYLVHASPSTRDLQEWLNKLETTVEDQMDCRWGIEKAMMHPTTGAVIVIMSRFVYTNQESKTEGPINE